MWLEKCKISSWGVRTEMIFYNQVAILEKTHHLEQWCLPWSSCQYLVSFGSRNIFKLVSAAILALICPRQNISDLNWIIYDIIQSIYFANV